MGGGQGKKRAPRWANHRQHSPAAAALTVATTATTNHDASLLSPPSTSASSIASPSSTPTAGALSEFSLPACTAVAQSVADAETARIVAEILDTQPVDLKKLRKVAVVRGLGTNALRARAWPLLLGARSDAGDLALLESLSPSSSSTSPSTAATSTSAKEGENGGGERQPSPPAPPLHRDAAVVDVDVERSLWAFTRGWSDAARASARASLRRVINAAVLEASRELSSSSSSSSSERGNGAAAVAGPGASDNSAGLRQRRRRRRHRDEVGASSSPTSSSSTTTTTTTNADSNGDNDNDDGGGDSKQTPSPTSTSSTVHYYQGLHDVASVLLLVTANEVAAFRLLRRLASCQLRDFTRPTLDAALEACDLLPAIVAAADPRLGKALEPSPANPGAPPTHYALPWLLTWFAHSASGRSSGSGGGGSGGSSGSGSGSNGSNGNGAGTEINTNDDTLNSAARLFDLFSASHPLMPLYVAAVAIVADRDRVLGALREGDPAESHAALSKVRVFGYRKKPPSSDSSSSSSSCSSSSSSSSSPFDELAAAAARLYRSCPPGPLAAAARRRGRAAASARESTAALAKLGEGGSWEVRDRLLEGEVDAAYKRRNGGVVGVVGGRILRQLRGDKKEGRQRQRQQRGESSASTTAAAARGVAAVAVAAGVAAFALLVSGPGGAGRG